MCKTNRAKVNEISDNDSANSFEECNIDMVSAGSTLFKDRVFTNLLLGPKKHSVSFKIDTGSVANILPYSHYKNLNLSNPLKPPDCKLTSYTGETLPVLGTVNLACRANSRSIQAKFHVVQSETTPLFGLKTSLDLELIKLTLSVEQDNLDNIKLQPLTKDAVVSKYCDLFTGIGNIQGECSLHLKENEIPSVNPPA